MNEPSAGTRYVEAPTVWDGEGCSVFLAGGITGCPDWQQEARRLLDGCDCTILNPRRIDFPIDDPTAGEGQIKWEFDHLHRATVILFWFPESEGPQPIALYELGRNVALGRPVVVGVDDRYSRGLDVEVQLRLAAPHVPLHDSLSDTCAEARVMLETEVRRLTSE